VQLQIRIAAGERLELEQDEVRPRGHAIECRIYAEDPENNFFPSPGKITRFQIASGPGVRHDSGIYEGWTVPLEYDPLLSKLIAFGGSRDEAIARMRRALDETFVAGITTNLSLFRTILDDSEFKAGNLDTGFLDRLLTGGTDLEEKPEEEKQQGEEDAVVAAMGMAILNALDSSTGKLNSKRDSEPNNMGFGRETGAAGGGLSGEASGWKQAGRLEGLRGQG
jgi:acetyl-CoA carboxylase biotin carboxylase subunit